MQSIEKIQYRYSSGELDADVMKYLIYLDKIGPLDYTAHKPRELRTIIDDFTLSYRRSKQADSVQRIQDATIDEIPVRYYVPHGSSPFPLLIYFHGGGWVFGSITSYDHLCQNIANRAQCMVCSVDYHLAPEHTFPTQVFDALRVISWLFEHADTLQVDPARVSVGGDSAGGNLAASVAGYLQNDSSCPLHAQVLFYPLLDASSQDTSSYQRYGEGYGLLKNDLHWFIQQYVPEGKDRRNPLVSPLLAKHYSGVPQSLIVTAEFDPLRDEAELYADRLVQAGVHTTCIRYNGLIHGFLLSDGVFSKVDSIITELCGILQSLL